jgi:hypothetical protein
MNSPLLAGCSVNSGFVSDSVRIKLPPAVCQAVPYIPLLEVTVCGQAEMFQTGTNIIEHEHFANQ